MRTTRRYYHPDSGGEVTPSQLGRLRKALQIEYLVHWFNQHFEDPAEETPYESREGGYQWIAGGPYDAQEQLSDEFGGVVSDDVIEQAVEEVQADGIYDWAPVRSDEDYDEIDDEPGPPDLDDIVANLGETPLKFGGVEELAARREIERRLSELETAVRTISPEVAGIGHNRPPEDLDPEEAPEAAIQASGVAIRAELVRTEPDARAVGRSASRLRAAGNYLLKKLDRLVDKAIDAIPVTGAIGYATQHVLINRALSDFVAAVAHWFATLMS